MNLWLSELFDKEYSLPLDSHNNIPQKMLKTPFKAIFIS